MFNCPLSPEKADRIISVLNLPPASRVIDIGCGAGEFLLRVIERYKAHGTGIDPDAAALAQCREQSTRRIPAENLSLHQLEASAYPWPPDPFDAAFCIGASHAFGGYLPMLQQLSNRIRPGGLIITGDLYWRKAPEPDYLQFLGDGFPPSGTDHAALAHAGNDLHLIPIYSARSNQDEWDHFEGTFALTRHHRAQSIPDKSERESALAKSRRWYDAYLRWGHSTMAFGFFVFVKSEA